MTRPDDIVIVVEEADWTHPDTGKFYKGFRYEEHYVPVKRWTFTQHVGVKRAEELGIWKSNDDPDRRWDIEDHITLYQYESSGDCILVVSIDQKEMRIHTYVDQWGTYYTFEGHDAITIASESGRIGFWKGYIEALEELRKRTEFTMRDPNVEVFDEGD